MLSLEKKREIDSEIKLIKGETEIKKELSEIDYYQKIQREKNRRFSKWFGFLRFNGSKKEIKRLMKQKNKLD